MNTKPRSPSLNHKNSVPWKEIGECKHKIRQSLTATIRMENSARILLDSAQSLRKDIVDELNKMDDIINKLGDKK